MAFIPSKDIGNNTAFMLYITILYKLGYSGIQSILIYYLILFKLIPLTPI